MFIASNAYVGDDRRELEPCGLCLHFYISVGEIRLHLPAICQSQEPPSTDTGLTGQGQQPTIWPVISGPYDTSAEMPWSGLKLVGRWLCTDCTIETGTYKKCDRNDRNHLLWTRVRDADLDNLRARLYISYAGKPREGELVHRTPPLLRRNCIDYDDYKIGYTSSQEASTLINQDGPSPVLAC